MAGSQLASQAPGERAGTDTQKKRGEDSGRQQHSHHLLLPLWAPHLPPPLHLLLHLRLHLLLLLFLVLLLHIQPLHLFLFLVLLLILLLLFLLLLLLPLLLLHLLAVTATLFRCIIIITLLPLAFTHSS
ncbi:unnamed protein product [Closterium sp. Yama58-4]|nr:unnamed protein product [Closterium sp. Yama58-4]